MKKYKRDNHFPLYIDLKVMSIFVFEVLTYETITSNITQETSQTIIL